MSLRRDRFVVRLIRENRPRLPPPNNNYSQHPYFYQSSRRDGVYHARIGRMIHSVKSNFLISNKSELHAVTAILLYLGKAER